MSYTPMSYVSNDVPQAYTDPPPTSIPRSAPCSSSPEFLPQAQLPNPNSISHPQQVYIVNFNAGNYPPQQLGVHSTTTASPGHWVYIPDPSAATQEQSSDGYSARATGGTSDAEERPDSPPRSPSPPDDHPSPPPDDSDNNALLFSLPPSPPSNTQSSPPPSRPPSGRQLRPRSLPSSSRPSSRPSTRPPSRVSSSPGVASTSHLRPIPQDTVIASPASSYHPPDSANRDNFPIPSPTDVPPADSALFGLPNLRSSLSSPAPPYKRSPVLPGYNATAKDAAKVGLNENIVREKTVSRRASKDMGVRFRSPAEEVRALQQSAVELDGRGDGASVHSSLTYLTLREEAGPVTSAISEHSLVDSRNTVQSWRSKVEDTQDEDGDEGKCRTASSCSLPSMSASASRSLPAFNPDAMVRMTERKGDAAKGQWIEVTYHHYEYASKYGWGTQTHEEGNDNSHPSPTRTNACTRPRVYSRLFPDSPRSEEVDSDLESHNSAGIGPPSDPPSFPLSPSEISWPSSISELPNLEDTDSEVAEHGYYVDASRTVQTALLEETRKRTRTAVAELDMATQALASVTHLAGSDDLVTAAQDMLAELHLLPAVFEVLVRSEISMVADYRPGPTEQRWVAARERYADSLQVNLRRVERVAIVLMHEIGHAPTEHIPRMIPRALAQFGAFWTKIRNLQLRIELASVVILRKRLAAIQQRFGHPFELLNTLTGLDPVREFERGWEGIDDRIRWMAKACRRSPRPALNQGNAAGARAGCGR
ncbi:hypothetical protein OF83DRAFT_770547 [Amylostereum chailletii]|nr:hypothetical protein OF83DRAFT_770547 [Amylostereum chailletii]